MKSNAKKVIEKRLVNVLKKTLKDAPAVLGLEGQRHFQENFNSKTFEGKKWKNVQRREPGTFAYKYPKNKYLARRTNPILVGRTRKLKNALSRSFRSRNSTKLTWRVDVGYAGYHNDGTKKIPKRTFMKITPKLVKRFKNKFEQMVKFNSR